MASKEIIKELFVLLGVEADEKDFKRAAESIDDLISLASKLALAGTAAAAGLIALTVQATNAGNTAAKTAKTLGITAEEVQALTYAAERGNATFEQLRTGFLKLQQRAAEAKNGNKEYRKEFAKLGVTFTGVNGRLKPGLVLLEEVAAALAKIPDPGERTRVAMKLFEEGGAQLLPFLNEMGDKLPELRKHFSDLGYAIDNETAAQSEEAADALQDVTLAVTGVTRRIGVGLIPILLRVSKRTTDWFIANRELIDGGINQLVRVVGFATMKVRQYIGTIVDLIGTKQRLKFLLVSLGGVFGLAFLVQLGAAAAGIYKVIVALKGAQKAMILTKLIAYAEFLAVGVAIAALILVIDELVTAVQGGDTLMGRFVKYFRGEGPADEWWVLGMVRDSMALLRTITDMVIRFIGLFSSNNAEVQASKNFWMTFWDDIIANWTTKLRRFFGGSIGGRAILLSYDLNKQIFGGIADLVQGGASAATTSPTGGTLIPPGSRPSTTYAPTVGPVQVTTGSGDPTEIGNAVQRGVKGALDETSRDVSRELGPS